VSGRATVVKGVALDRRPAWPEGLLIRPSRLEPTRYGCEGPLNVSEAVQSPDCAGQWRLLSHTPGTLGMRPAWVKAERPMRCVGHRGDEGWHGADRDGCEQQAARRG
jgi:hypothetical protein